MQVRRTRLGLFCGLVAVVLAGCAVPPVREGAAVPSAPATPIRTADVIPVKFARAETASLAPGGFNVQFGWLCERGGRKSWQQLPSNHYALLFSSALRDLGFKVEEPTNSLFDNPEDGSDIQIGARIEAAEANLCFPFSGRPSLDVGNPDRVKGHALMAVRWEVYSRSRKQVVYSVRTEAGVTLPESVQGGSYGVYARLFRGNAERLAADPGFRQLVMRRSPTT